MKADKNAEAAKANTAPVTSGATIFLKNKLLRNQAQLLPKLGSGTTGYSASMCKAMKNRCIRWTTLAAIAKNKNRLYKF